MTNEKNTLRLYSFRRPYRYICIDPRGDNLGELEYRPLFDEGSKVLMWTKIETAILSVLCVWIVAMIISVLIQW
jgi:hypothetical protein